jgi:hypothetical protein
MLSRLFQKLLDAAVHHGLSEHPEAIKLADKDDVAQHSLPRCHFGQSSRSVLALCLGHSVSLLLLLLGDFSFFTLLRSLLLLQPEQKASII